MVQSGVSFGCDRTQHRLLGFEAQLPCDVNYMGTSSALNARRNRGTGFLGQFPPINTRPTLDVHKKKQHSGGLPVTNPGWIWTILLGSTDMVRI